MPKYVLQSVSGREVTVNATNEDTARIIAMKELYGAENFTLHHPTPAGQYISEPFVGLGLSLIKERKEKENATSN